MSTSEKMETTGAITTAMPSTPPAEDKAEKMCQGRWRLMPRVVLRVEDDGAFLYDPERESMSIINLTGSALLQWGRERICFTEWCEILHSRYKGTPLAQLQADIKKFLNLIAPFAEPFNDDHN